MSHFTVLVTGDDLDAALTPFDEKIGVPEYIESTKAEIIAKERRYIHEYRDGLYAEYLADPEKYIREHTNHPSHLAYLAVEFPKKLTWTDEQVYSDATRHDKLDAEGNRLSTYNPKSKWDWWQIGGRWDRGLRTKDGRDVNITTAGELDLEKNGTFAILHVGEWIERGRMGWWGIVTDEQPDEDWRAMWRNVIESLPPETSVTLIDAHI